MNQAKRPGSNSPHIHGRIQSRRTFLKTAAMLTASTTLSACIPQAQGGKSGIEAVAPESTSEAQMQLPSTEVPELTDEVLMQPTDTIVPEPTSEAWMQPTSTEVPAPQPTELPTSTAAPVQTIEIQFDSRCGPPERAQNYVITSLCLRDGACVDVCPVEAIVGGKPEEEWPRYYIDQEACIQCNACIPVCPYEAIFPPQETPSQYILRAGQEVQLAPGWRYVATGNEIIDLTRDIGCNVTFFEEGPGYNARS
jgi:ferredoxin